MAENLLTQLDDAPGLVEPEALAGPDHPMRAVTRQVAFEQGWSSGRARKIGELFDGLAPEWDESHRDDVRLAPLRDAISRGDVGSGRWLELGAGTGAGTRVFEEHVEHLTAVDLSAQMLLSGHGRSPRMRADASQLPFVNDRFDGILMVNMLLFPEEVDRVLAPEGQIVWVNTLGERTPIHLPADDVLGALPGTWTGSWARAGSGLWLVGRRHSSPRGQA